MEENKNLLLKGAMTYGLAMGIYWVVKYIFFIFSVSVPSLSLVYWLLTLAVPFIAYYMTKRYRHDIGGRISFFHAWRFGTMLYFFAALIVSLEYFVFYQFIAPPDFVANAIGQLTTVLKAQRRSLGFITLLYSAPACASCAQAALPSACPIWHRTPG